MYLFKETAHYIYLPQRQFSRNPDLQVYIGEHNSIQTPR